MKAVIEGFTSARGKGWGVFVDKPNGDTMTAHHDADWDGQDGNTPLDLCRTYARGLKARGWTVRDPLPKHPLRTI